MPINRVEYDKEYTSFSFYNGTERISINCCEPFIQHKSDDDIDKFITGTVDLYLFDFDLHFKQQSNVCIITSGGSRSGRQSYNFSAIVDKDVLIPALNDFRNHDESDSDSKSDDDE